MSYILEALKKSDTKRKQEESLSVLHQTHTRPPFLKKKKHGRSKSTVLALSLVAFAAGLIIWYLSATDQPVDTENLQATHAPANQSLIQPELQPEALPDSQTELQTEQQPKQQSTPPSIPELRPASKKIRIAAPGSLPEANVVLEPKPLSGGEPAKPEDPLQSSDKTPHLEDFPVSFQAKVPKLRLAGHVFSPEPQLRMIMINNKIVREGEIIETNLTLEKITQNGVILRQDGERFQLTAY